MQRPKFIAGNWKMFTTQAVAAELARAVVAGCAQYKTKIALCPPFTAISTVVEAVRGSAVTVGSQNCYFENEGAFTGEIAPQMLLDVGCKHVILGHSERRHVLGESDEMVNRKVKAALAAGLEVIFCIGETQSQRQADQTESVLAVQLTSGLAGLSASDLNQIVIAYEPVWAIGTGVVATPEQAQKAHVFIRGTIAGNFGENAAAKLLIQYGGSVKPENATTLLHLPDVDGALVGGASLKADLFLAIIRAAQ